jgi:hypothetical protein
LADTSGIVRFEARRAEKQLLTGVNVKKTRWFSNALQDRENEHTEIVKMDNKKLFLKSWVSADMKDLRGPCILTVLIDLERILTEFRGKSNTPVALLFNKQIIYESDWVNDIGNEVDIPNLGGIKIAFADIGEQIEPSIVQDKSANDRVLFLIITALSLLIGAGGLVSFLISQKSLSKIKNESILKLEEEKLSDTEKEKIHKLAVSHVYCEVKRQVETHEIDAITKKVRGEIEASIRNSSTRNEDRIPELHSV